MCMLSVHLRWNHVDAALAEGIRATVPGEDLPPGCLSRTVRRQGDTLLAEEVWDSEESGGHLDQLVNAVRAAGVDQKPQTAIFAIPEVFAVAYRRPRSAPAIPTQRDAALDEQRPATAAAGIR